MVYVCLCLGVPIIVLADVLVEMICLIMVSDCDTRLQGTQECRKGVGSNSISVFSVNILCIRGATAWMVG